MCTTAHRAAENTQASVLPCTVAESESASLMVVRVWFLFYRPRRLNVREIVLPSRRQSAHLPCHGASGDHARGRGLERYRDTTDILPQGARTRDSTAEQAG
jgi:hypothetical protein